MNRLRWVSCSLIGRLTEWSGITSPNPCQTSVHRNSKRFSERTSALISPGLASPSLRCSSCLYIVSVAVWFMHSLVQWFEVTCNSTDLLTSINLKFTGPCIANIFAEYDQQDAMFHNFFISVRRSTCFRLVFRPPGAQNCTYSVRYLSDRYCYQAG